MSGPDPIPGANARGPLGRLVLLLAVLPLGVAVASEFARLLSALGHTLGHPVPAFGAASWTAVAAASLHAAVRRPSALGASLGALFVLAAFVCLDIDVPRRRGLLLAIGLASTLDLGRFALARAVSRGRLWGPTAAAILLAAAAGVFLSRQHSERAPLRGDLHPRAKDGSPASAQGAPRSNSRSIVLITMDTTRRSDLGCYGQTRPATPNIDRFAAGAVRFLRAYSTSPFTAPSMASMMTGQLPVDHGSIAAAPMLSPQAVTLAEHCYGSGFETAGFLDNPWLGTDFGLARGYEYLSRHTDLREVEAWLDARAGRRFLLHVHLFHPHGPYDLRRDELDALGGARAPASAMGVGTSITARKIRDGEVPGRSGLSADEIQWAHEIYLTEVRAMDRWIGGLFEVLEARGLMDTSVIALAADHGEEFGERGGMHHSHTLYGELVHVPLIVRAPGLAPGVREGTVSLSGLGPELAGLAGLDPMPGGDSRIPWVWDPGSTGTGRLPVAVSMRCRQAGRHFLRVTTARWALHVRLIPGSSPTEMHLFDLAADPGETSDVLAGFTGIAQQLLALPEVAGPLEKLQAVPLAAAPGNERTLTPRTASDLRVLGYAR